MSATLTLSESFVSGMDWEDIEVRVEEMEWEPSYIEDEAPLPVSKKVSPSPNLIFLKEKATTPQPEKVSSPLKHKPNLSLKVKLTSPTPQKVSPLTSEFIRHKFRCKPKVSIPEVSTPKDRVILKPRRPSLPRI
ncbi:hypothetical protein TNCV_4341221 [Trichonephila clavipes]|nr:hypothetical protein TNCV_4341221 [Trichonephila clavipes]